MTLNSADRLLRFKGEAPISPVFRREVEAFLEVTGTRPLRFGIDSCDDPNFVYTLRAGGWARLTVVEHVREWMRDAASPSQREAIARMLEDGDRPKSTSTASRVKRGDRRRGKTSRISNADKDIAGDHPAEDRPADQRQVFLNTSEAAAFRGVLSRRKLLDFVASQPRCVVAIEACATAHYWGREILQARLTSTAPRN